MGRHRSPGLLSLTRDVQRWDTRESVGVRWAGELSRMVDHAGQGGGGSVPHRACTGWLRPDGSESARVVGQVDRRLARVGGLRAEELSSEGYCSFGLRIDRNGKMAVGAIANLVDEVGGAAMHADGHQMKVSVDMSISFLSKANLHDELEITSRVLGHRGGSYTGTYVLVRNKTGGEVVAEGRHSLFGNLKSKI